MPVTFPPVAPLGRRIVALFVDWGMALAISVGFFRANEWVTLGLFLLMTWLLVGTLGASVGHVLAGLAVRTAGRGLPGPGRALVRTLALGLVIPAVVWGADGRGLHDMWAGTVITKIR